MGSATVDRLLREPTREVKRDRQTDRDNIERGTDTHSDVRAICNSSKTVNASKLLSSLFVVGLYWVMLHG